MTDAAQFPAALAAVPETKWWAQSMTVWGAAITALTTVLPAVDPRLGVEITPALIQQFGDQAVGVAQAGGGLLGIFLAIFAVFAPQPRLGGGR